MTSPSRGQVHICHAPGDRKYVVRLGRHLAAAGIRSTYDAEPTPELPADLVHSRVDASDALLVIMTPASASVPRVEEAIARARQIGREIFPLQLANNDGFYLLNGLDFTDVTDERMPGELLLGRLRSVVGAPPPPPEDRRGMRRAVTIAGAFVVVAAIILAVTVWPRGTGTATPPVPASSHVASADAALPPGSVRVTGPADDAVVDRCAKVTGVANLDGSKTLLFGVNRTGPPSPDWYFTYAAGFRNGFVANEWTADVYLGSVTRQSYDVLVLVMDVPAAQTFYAAHQTKDGSYAFNAGLPPGAVTGAHVRLRQGNTDDC